MRMIEAHRMLRRGQVVSQDQIQFVLAISHSGNRRDRVVRLTVGFREDHRVGVRIAAPLGENFAREVTELLLVRRVQTKHRHRVLHDTAVHILKARHFKAELFLGLLHREGMMAALKMFVRQNAAAHDGKVCVRAEEVVRELLDERKQLIKRRAVDDHRRVLSVHHDRVFIIIDIRRILEAPRLVIHRHRHHAKILPCRVRDRSRVADVFDAKKAFRIPRRLFQLRRRDIARVFFGLGEVDGNFEFTVLRVGNPVLVLCDAVAANIIAVLTELVEIVRRRFRGLCVERPELAHHLRGPRRDAAHEPRVKQVALRNRVVDLSLFYRVIAQKVQTFWKTMAFHLFFVALQFQFRQKCVSGEGFVQRVQQAAVLRVIEQRIQRGIYRLNLHSHADAPCASSTRNR